MEDTIEAQEVIEGDGGHAEELDDLAKEGNQCSYVFCSSSFYYSSYCFKHSCPDKDYMNINTSCLRFCPILVSDLKFDDSIVIHACLLKWVTWVRWFSLSQICSAALRLDISSSSKNI